MSIGNMLRTIHTPMGNLICTMDNDPDYPCFRVVLRTPTNEEILLSVVEHDKEQNRINLHSYMDLSCEEPDYSKDIWPEDVERYMADAGGESTEVAQ